MANTQVDPNQPFTYRDIADLYDQMGGSAKFGSLRDFSNQANQATNSKLFQQGVNDNLVKQASTGIDRAIEWTGLPEVTGGIGEWAGGLVGMPELGRQMGEHLPRDLATLGTMAIPVAGVPIAAGLTAADAYTQGASPLNAAVQGLAMGAIGPVAHLGGELGLKWAGAPLLKGVFSEGIASPAGAVAAKALGFGEKQVAEQVGKYVSRYVPETLGQKLSAYAGSQGAITAEQELAQMVGAGLDSNQDYNPFTKEHLFQTVAGQLQFAPFDAMKVFAKTVPHVEMAKYIEGSRENLLDQKQSANDIIEPTGTVVSSKPSLTAEQTKLSIDINTKYVNDRMAVEADATLAPAVRNAALDNLQAKYVTDLEALKLPPVSATPKINKPILQEVPDTEFQVQPVHETAKGLKLKVMQGPEDMVGKNFWVSKKLVDNQPGSLSDPDANGLRSLKFNKDKMKLDLRPDSDWIVKGVEQKKLEKQVDAQLTIDNLATEKVVGTKFGQPVVETKLQLTPEQKVAARQDIVDGTDALFDGMDAPTLAKTVRFIDSSLQGGEASINSIPLEVRNAFDPSQHKLLSQLMSIDPGVVRDQLKAKVEAIDPLLGLSEAVAKVSPTVKLEQETQKLRDSLTVVKAKEVAAVQKSEAIKPIVGTDKPTIESKVEAINTADELSGFTTTDAALRAEVDNLLNLGKPLDQASKVAVNRRINISKAHIGLEQANAKRAANKVETQIADNDWLLSLEKAPFASVEGQAYPHFKRVLDTLNDAKEGANKNESLVQNAIRGMRNYYERKGGVIDPEVLNKIVGGIKAKFAKSKPDTRLHLKLDGSFSNDDSVQNLKFNTRGEAETFIEANRDKFFPASKLNIDRTRLDPTGYKARPEGGKFMVFNDYFGATKATEHTGTERILDRMDDDGIDITAGADVLDAVDNQLREENAHLGDAVVGGDAKAAIDFEGDAKSISAHVVPAMESLVKEANDPNSQIDLLTKFSDKDRQWFGEKVQKVMKDVVDRKGDDDIIDGLHEYYDVDTSDGRRQAEQFVDQAKGVLLGRARIASQEAANVVSSEPNKLVTQSWVALADKVGEEVHKIVQPGPDQNVVNVAQRVINNKSKAAPQDHWAFDVLNHLVTYHGADLTHIPVLSRVDGQPLNKAHFSPVEGREHVYVGERHVDGMSDVGSALGKYALTLAHETAHALTYANYRRATPEQQGVMSGWRQKAVDKLPPTLRKLVDRAQATDAYGRYVKNETQGIDWKISESERRTVTEEMKKLGLNGEDYNGFLYSFISPKPDEFMAQSFNNRALQRYLQSIPHSKESSLWQPVRDWVKRALGFNTNEQGSLFDKVIESVADVQTGYEGKSFYDRRGLLANNFGNAGHTISDTASLTHIAEALGPESGNSKLTRAVTESQLDTLKPQQEFLKRWSETDEGKVWFGEAQKILDLGEWGHGDLAELVIGLQEVNSPKIHEVWDSAPRPVVDYMEQVINVANDVHRAWQDWDAHADKGLVNRRAFGGKAGLISERAIKRIRNNTALLTNTLNAYPEGFGQLLEDRTMLPAPPLPATPKVDGAGQIRETLLDGLNLTGKGAEAFVKWITPFTQLAKIYPQLQPIMDASLKYSGDIRSMRAKLFDPMSYWFADGGGVRSDEMLKKNEAAMNDPKLLDLVDKVSRFQQRQEREFDWSKDLAKVEGLASLGKSSLESVKNLSMVLTTQTKLVQDMSMRSQEYKGINNAAKLIVARTGIQADKAKLLAKQLYGAVANGDAAAMQAVNAAMGNDGGFTNILKFVTDDTIRLQDLQTFYAKRPWFASAQRFERFVVNYEQGGVESTSRGFDSEKEMNHWINMKKAADPTFRNDPPIDKKSTESTAGINRSVLEKLREVEGKRRDQLKGLLAPTHPELAAELESFPLGVDDLMSEMMSRATVLPGSRRKLKGLENVPMFINHQNYLMMSASSMAKDLLRSEVGLRLADPALKERQDLWQLSKQHVENFLAPDTPLGAAMTRGAFNYYIGFRMSTMMLEAAQAPLTHAAQLTSEGAGVSGSYKLLLNAAKSIGQWAIRGKKYVNPEHQALERRALEEGQIALGPFDFWGVDQDAVRTWNTKLASQGKTGMNGLSDLVKNGLFQLEKIATNLYGVTTHFNARLALISSFDFYRAQGDNFDTAYAKAKMFNAATNMSAGRVGRPVGLFSGRTKVGRTASQALYSLQSYNFGAMAMMFRLAHEGIMSNTSVPMATRRNARKAFFQMAVTQLAYAGALGMPAVGALITLAENMNPDLELRKGLQGLLSSFGGGDEELGKMVADVGMNGLASAILPVDVGSRMAIGNSIMGVNSYNGFDASNIFGPSVGMMKDITKGIASVAQGDIVGGVTNLAPMALKDVIKAWNSDFKFRDQTGALLREPTPGETFGMLVGFAPAEVRRMKDMDRIKRRAQEIDQREVRNFNTKVAEMVEAGDISGAQAALQQRQMENPLFSAQAGAKGVANEMERRNIPKDPRRLGGARTALGDTQLNQSFNVNTAPSEMSRMQYRAQIEQLLGGVGPSPSSYRRAAEIDNIMTQNPFVGRAMAQQIREQPDLISQVAGAF